MSEYSTGELSERFNVSKRSLQFYDKKGLLKPAYIKRNGYRVYTDTEVERLKLIVILKRMDLSLKDIRVLLEEDKGLKAIRLMVERKIDERAHDIKIQQQQLAYMKHLKSMITANSHSQINQLIGIDEAMSKNKQRQHLHIQLVVMAGIGTFIQVVGLSVSFAMKHYLPFLMSFILGVGCAALLTRRYYQAVSYMCPQCHFEFQPKLLSFMFASHTSKTRKLTCPHCHQRHHCVEIVNEENRDMLNSTSK